MLVILPLELHEVILQHRDHLETATLTDFISCFGMKVMSNKKVLLHYRPTNKFMIASYESISDNDESFTINDVIDNLIHNIHAMLEECENATEMGQLLKWNCTISYQQYCENNNTNLMADLTLKEFCEWRNEFLKFKKLVGQERFDKLISLTKESD